MKIKPVLALALFALGTASARAAVIPGETSDSVIHYYDVEQTSNATLISQYFNDFNNTVAVFAFQLPTLSAGQSFASASVSISVSFPRYTPTGYDLYGDDARASSAVTTQDWSSNPVSGTRPSAGVLLQKDLLSAANYTVGIKTADITSYLNTQYAGGTNAGEYVFLRVQPGAFGTSGTEVQFDSADSPNAAVRPVVNYTVASSVVAPEASSVLLIASGLLTIGGVALRRRRVA